MYSRQDRIGILIFGGYPVAFSPTILNTALFWANSNYRVDLLIERPALADIENLSSLIEVHYCNNHDAMPAIKNADVCVIGKERLARYRYIRLFVNRFVFLKRCLLKILGIYALIRWGSRFLKYMYAVNIFSKNSDYKFLIGFEAEGLIAAYLLSIVYKLNFYYHSLEIYEPPNNLTDQIKKFLEKIANKKAIFTVIQDLYRAKELMRANGIDKEQIKIMPVSLFGPAIKTRTDYFRERFKIPANKKIILYLGGITSDMCCLEVAAQSSSADWDDNWILIFHGFTSNINYIQKILSVSKSDRFILSLDTVSMRDLDSMTSSADIGIALYLQNNKNNEYAISSSGKIAQYFKCGLPVIVNAVRQNEKLMNNFHSGFCVHEHSEIPMAISSILMDYEKYREGAFSIFTARYDFEQNYNKLLTTKCWHRLFEK